MAGSIIKKKKNTHKKLKIASVRASKFGILKVVAGLRDGAAHHVYLEECSKVIK